MARHIFRDLEDLHKHVLTMCSKVEALMHRAVDGLQARDAKLAAQLAIADKEIDAMDVRIEEECLKILALHQPVAVDLRRTAAVLRIVSELERVADLAVNISERACGISDFPELPVPPKLSEMSRIALDMLHRSIDAFVNLDSEDARQVCLDDDQVDDLNVEILSEIKQTMQGSPYLIDPGMHLFSATRHLERVADHATNIAEDVVYLVEGEIIRHRPRNVSREDTAL